MPYKKADLVVAAFTRLGLPLVVVGDGPQLDECRRLAGMNVKFLGYQDPGRCHRGRHDVPSAGAGLRCGGGFRHVPVEAQSCGTPVIAYGKGGVEDTVVPVTRDNWESATGLFFYEQSVEALEAAVRQFLAWEGRFRPEVMRCNAERFGRERFKKEIALFVDEKRREFLAGLRS